MAFRKRKKKPVTPDVQQPPIPLSARADNGTWSGTPDLLTDATSQKAGDAGGDVGAGLSAPAYTQPGETTAGVETPAQAFIAAVRANDKSAIKASYANLPQSGPAGIAAAYEIKDAFFNGSDADRATFKANVTANKELFPAKSFANFQTMMTMTSGAVETGMRWMVGPRPKETKPAAGAVGLEGGAAAAQIAAITGVSHSAGVRLSGLNPTFASRVGAAIRDAEAATGQKATIISGVRSTAQQAGLYAAYKAGKGNIAAPPGSSLHEHGMAVDLAPGKVRDWIQAHAATYGLEAATAHDRAHGTWGQDAAHIQLARGVKTAFDNAPPITAAATGASAAPAAPSGRAAAGGSVEAYIRQSAIARGIDPNIAVRVAKGEGGLSDPLQQSYVVKDGKRETSYGPFQLRIGGGLGDAALKAGIDPRKESDWRAGVDFALNHAAEHGWGEWYGAVNPGPKSGLSPIASNAGLAGAKPVPIGSAIAGAATQDVAVGAGGSRGDANILADAIRSGGLRKGSRNIEANKALQATLNTLGVPDRSGNPLKVDGVFGNRTKEAVKAYQGSQGIPTDGVVGPVTFGKIADEMAAQHPATPASAAEMRGLQPTPQEMHLYAHHLQELSTGGVKNPDGSVSTVLQTTVERDGRVYNIPMVWGGKVLSPQDAMKRAAQDGWDSWPSYPSEAAAQSRYNAMHGAMEMDVGGVTPFGVGAGTMPGAGIQYAMAPDEAGLNQWARRGKQDVNAGPELVGNRSFAAGAAAASIAVNPKVQAALSPSGSATLRAALEHPNEDFATERGWDPAAARIAGTLRTIANDQSAMEAAQAAQKASGLSRASVPPVEADTGVTIPKSFEEWLGGGPGKGPGREHQFPQDNSLENWLSAPTAQSNGAGEGLFGNVSSASSDPYRPGGGSSSGGYFNPGGSGSFDDFASGMSSAYQSAVSGGGTFGGETGGGSGTVYSGFTSTPSTVTSPTTGTPLGSNGMFGSGV